MILLDTSFLIDLLKERRNAVDKAAELVNRDILATTYVNIYELLIGVFNKKGIDYEKKMNTIEHLTEKLEVLTLEKDSTIKSAEIGGELMLKGQIVGDTDNMIAGIALSNGINTIVTRDKEHFKRVKGIKVEGY
ncbi:type II toxin-antitoxin system VapC family toxin [Candidatus Woesearchaeota archaeon]|nr:type II toxin-antitoxin system VapC family toxin [Candidatus Woesearchaeota archaeon]